MADSSEIEIADTSTGTHKRRASVGSQRNPASQEAILNAAQELLLEGGPGAFSIEAVARRAKAGKPTIYRWWPSKTALLLDVYHRQKAMVTYPDTGSIESDLLGLITSLLEIWKGPAGAVFRSIIAEAQSDAGAAKALSDYAAERRERSGRMVQRAQARGEVAADVVPEVVAETISSFAWGRLLTNRLDADPNEVRAAVHHLVVGIKSR